jgi:hypothetical protein
LFGVDINPNSVKICRLRLWIELLKNAYYKAETNYTELETLPNIDINIKCGNSLISRFKLDDDLSKALKSIKYDVKAYRGFVKDYKHEKNRETKKALQLIIDNIKGDFITQIAQSNPIKKRLDKLVGELYYKFGGMMLMEPEMPYGNKKKANDKKKELEKEIEELQEKLDETKSNKIYKNAFEWRFEFPEVLNDNGSFKGFDLVIGNPPYIRHEEIKHLKPQLQKDYLVFNSSADLLSYFFELGNRILKKGGILSFIVSNKFFKATYGSNLRSYLMKDTAMQQIIEFDKVNIFDEATVKAAIVQYSKLQSTQSFTYLNVKEKNNELYKLIEEQGTQYEQKLFNSNQWIFQSKQQSKVFDKIFEKGTPLSEWNIEIYRGLLTGLNEAFLIDEETKTNLIKENKLAANLIKPLFRGREIEKYFSAFCSSYIIGTFPSLKLDIEKYPSIKNYLLQFGKEKLEQSGNVGSRKKTSNKWFETQDATAYFKEFEQPKIIWKRIGSKLRFCYDETGTYSLDSTCIATGNHLKYLVGVLNSKLIEAELNRFAPKTGTGDLIISVQALSPLRIPIPNEKQEKQMNTLVDKIITAKQQNQSTTALEKQIDEMVYELYGLTKDEIEIVETVSK